MLALTLFTPCGRADEKRPWKCCDLSKLLFTLFSLFEINVGFFRFDYILFVCLFVCFIIPLVCFVSFFLFLLSLMTKHAFLSLAKILYFDGSFSVPPGSVWNVFFLFFKKILWLAFVHRQSFWASVTAPLKRDITEPDLETEIQVRTLKTACCVTREASA